MKSMRNYKLVYEENFDIDGKPDPEVWTFEVGEKWSNNESQCYVDSLENCYIKDGKLNLVATIHDTPTCKYRSTRMNTFKKKHFQYGKFIVRAKMPVGKGSWPAIWFLGSTKTDIRWPKCGEIDLLEFAGNRPGIVSCAIHTEAYNHKIDTQIGRRKVLETASTEFHDYSLEWTKDFLSFGIDGKEYLKINRKKNDTFAEWPFDQPYFMILNLAVGGWYAGEIDDKDLPYHFQIDSIKVYQE
jgi:beta-glucanase (GH16 family)